MAECSELRTSITIEREFTEPVPCPGCGGMVVGFKLAGNIVGRVADGAVSEPWKVDLAMTFEDGRSEMLPCGCRSDGLEGEF